MKKVCVIVLCILTMAFAMVGCEDPAVTYMPTSLGYGEVGHIDTPYGSLSLPEKWKDQIRMERDVKENTFVLKFFGRVTEQGEYHLYDLVFGETEGDQLGYIVHDDKTIPVFVIAYDITPDPGWTKEERSDLYAMRDSINAFLEQLNQMEQFVALG